MSSYNLTTNLLTPQLFYLRLLIGILFLLIMQDMHSQELQGRIFNNDQPVAGILIRNLRSEASTFSTEDGYFTLQVRENDSLTFSAPYFESKSMMITSRILEKPLIVELERTNIALEEVVVEDKMTEKEFKPMVYSKDLNTIIKEDIQAHPEKYYPMSSNYGLDFISLLKSIVRLFRKRPSGSNTPEQPNYITAAQIDSLVQKHDLVNTDLLRNDLKIATEQEQLFFLFLETKELDNTLLLPDKELKLLESLLLAGDEFTRLQKSPSSQFE